MRKVSICAVVVASILLGACSGGSGKAKTSGDADRGLPPCELSALAPAAKPVQVTYWHAMTRANEDELKKLTAAFNAQQPDVHVTLSAAASYTDNFTRFKAGLSTGVLPDLMQGEDTSTQAMIDSQAVLPVASCIEADHASTSDLIPRLRAYYSVNDVLWPMPFNNSNPVLYYNKNAFEKAGLDPDKPPSTLDEVKADSRQIVRSGAAPFGLALKTDAWYFEHWLAKAGHTLVNNGNGRTARATAVTFDDPTGISLFRWIDEMVTVEARVEYRHERPRSLPRRRERPRRDDDRHVGRPRDHHAALRRRSVPEREARRGRDAGPGEPRRGRARRRCRQLHRQALQPGEAGRGLRVRQVPRVTARAIGMGRGDRLYTCVGVGRVDGAPRAEVRATARVQGRLRPAPCRTTERSDGRARPRCVRRQGFGCTRRDHRRHREGHRSAVHAGESRERRRVPGECRDRGVQRPWKRLPFNEKRYAKELGAPKLFAETGTRRWSACGRGRP